MENFAQLMTMEAHLDSRKLSQQQSQLLKQSTQGLDVLQNAASPRSLNNFAFKSRGGAGRNAANHNAVASTAADELSVFETNQPGWEAQQKFKQLL